MANVMIGCAGWALGPGARAEFPSEGTHIQRYAAVFPAVEINSSFYRPHRVATYAKWAASVPESFRFAVKIPKTITHTQRLVDAEGLVETFLGEVSGLRDKLGALLVQLPPSLELDLKVAERFFADFRRKHSGDVFLEPRHKTWFTADADRLLQDAKVGRVAADPAVVPAAAEPAGATDKVYFRLHGSPQVYYSAYADEYLDELAIRLREYRDAGVAAWCIFDNTARGEAIRNSLDLMRRLSPTSPIDLAGKFLDDKGSAARGESEVHAPAIEIRTFDEKDEQDVIALWERCGLLRPWNDPHKDIARKLHVQRDLFLVGTIDASIVATVMGGYEGHRGWVNYLAVDPASRRRGYGRTLMSEIERRLRALGCPKVSLQIRAENKDAIEFYDRIGFAEDAVISMGKRLQHVPTKEELS
jgi:uncharacterized protein YecE (DUF72 family)/ribosomal protein S18 acetylase RimI-like enzyme